MNEIKHIGTDRLKVDATNVRVSAASAEAHNELVASIRSHGLLENLVVTPRDDGTFGVVAGGRRLAALKAIQAEDGGVPFEVPCLVVNGDLAAEASLAENQARVAMHPADQGLAYADLAAKGATVEQIGARFGVSPHTVRKWLRVGRLPEDVLNEFRDGTLAHDAAIALASMEDPAQAGRLYREIKKGMNGEVNEWAIRRALDERATSSDGKLATFVGLEAYAEAGGRYEETLFYGDGDEVRLHDPDVLLKCAVDKLEAAAKARTDDGGKPWKWHGAVVDYDCDEQNKYHQTHPVRPPRTEEQEAAFAKLDEDEERLDAQWDNREITEEEANERQEALHERRRALHAEAEDGRDFPEGVPELAGCLYTIDHLGRLAVVKGLVRNEDWAAYQKLMGSKAQGATSSGGKPRKATGAYANSVRDDLRLIRGAAFRFALAEHPNLAVDLFTFTMARKGLFQPVPHGLAWSDADVLTTGRGEHNHQCSNKLRQQLGDVHEATFAQPVPDAVDLSWVAEEDQGKAWAAFSALDEVDKETVLAHCIAAMAVPTLTDDETFNAPLESAAKSMGIDYPARLREIGIEWTEELFWSRLTKAQILREAGVWLGEEWVKQHKAMKKGELAAEMCAEVRSSVPHFVPVGFEDGPGA